MDRPKRDLHELYRRAVAYVDRRGGAAIRRGGRLDGAGTGASGSGGSGGSGGAGGKTLALSNFTGANYFQTAVGGGEAGVATGFGAFFLVRVNALGAAASRHLTNRANAGGSSGWLPFITTTNQVTFLCGDGVAAAIQAPVYQLVPSDVSRVLALCVWHDGVKVRLAVSRTQAGDGTAITGYTSVNVPTVLANNAAAPTTNGIATAIDVLAAETFRGAPSNEQLAKLFDQARILGDVPALFPLDSAGDADIAALAPRHWYRADTYTPNAGNLGALTNRNLTVGGQLIVTAGTLALPAADALLNGQPSIVFNATQWLDSSFAPSEFRYMHNTEDTFVVFVPEHASTRVVLATRSNGAGAGIHLYHNSLGHYGVSLSSDAALLFSQAAAYKALGNAGFLESSYSDTATPKAVIWGDALSLATPTPSGAPYTGNPTGTLRLGASAVDNQFPFIGRVADVISFDRVLTSAERQKVRDYIRVRYGIGAITTTHRWSARDASAGQLLPVTGFPTLNDYLEASGSGGIRGHASGAWCAALVEFNALAGNEAIVTAIDSNSGYDLMKYGGTFLTGRRNAAGTYAAINSYTLVAGDVNRKMLLGWDHDGAQHRQFVDGTLRGSGAAPTLVPSNVPMRIGSEAGTYSAGNMRIYGVVGGDGQVPTPAEWLALFNSTTAAGVIGQIPGKTTHRWQLGSTTPALSASLTDTVGTDSLVVRGGVQRSAPVSLADTVTGAAIDRMDRVGMATLRVPDASADGRKTYGALGCTDANYLQSTGLGIAGIDTGFHVRWRGRVWAGAAARAIFGNRDAADTTVGYVCWLNSSVLTFTVKNAAGASVSLASITVSASDLGQELYIVVQHTGSQLQIFFRRGNGTVTQVGADLAITGYKPSTAPMRLGVAPGGVAFGGDIDHFDIDGGHTVLSLAEVQAGSDAALAQGKLVATAKTQHSWLIAADILANGGPDNGIPLQVLDRIGTDHLTRVGGLKVANGGLTGFGAGGYPQSLTIAAGLPGLATALWVEALIDTPSGPSGAAQAIFGNTGASANGLAFRYSAVATLVAQFGDGATSFTANGGPMANNTRFHVCATYDGSVGQVYINGVASGSPTASFVYAPGSQPTKLGTNYAGTSEAATTAVVRGVAGGHAVPTPAEIAAASAYALANGRVGGIAGKTLRLYDLVQDVIDAGNKPPPAVVKDRISNIDHLPIVGSPLQVAQRLEKTWSYEVSPIFRGGQAWSLADYFETLVNALPGDPNGFTASVLFVVTSQAVVSQGRRLFAQRHINNPGWEFATTGQNNGVNFSCGGANSAISPAVTFAATDIGKLFLVTGVYDAISFTARLYAKRVQQGGGTSLPLGYAPELGIKPMIGRKWGGSPADGVAIYGVSYAPGIATLAQTQAQYDAVMTTERMQGVPGMPGALIDLTQDVAGGSTLPATLVDRGTLGANFTKVGNPQLAAMYARAWAA